MVQVRNLITVMPAGYGHKKVSLTTMDGERLHAITANTILTDRFNSDDDDERQEAKLELVDLVMSENNIDNYEII